MGVVVELRKNEDAFESRFLDSTTVECANINCLMGAVDLHLVHEDAEMISYSGACVECGKEYNLSHMKEES